ncbi:MAG: DUF255 domain-containing protein [Magnetococcales bacterium]|nr:DUF255 domain-containing protein [Magnetococcales bacterium]
MMRLLIMMMLSTLTMRIVDASEGVGPLPRYPEALQTRLQKVLKAKGQNYQPRTEHLNPDGSPLYTNRLILESSPYLVQHAHNPVDWYPWGGEAFEKARQENKLIFLSIGYATCHWCHVMERESFEDPDVADYLNRHYIAIKVDRENRPDVDAVYMRAVNMLTGRGGWPLSSFLTPEGKTIFGGTYYPKPAFLKILTQGTELWRTRQKDLLEQAEHIALAVQDSMKDDGETTSIGERAMEQAIAQMAKMHDEFDGGFSTAPKFPNEPLLHLLMVQAIRKPDSPALEMARRALDGMAAGGIHDQFGGGFHRYSVDSHWTVPHFEKMLYNQGHLTQLYLEAYRLTGDPVYRHVAVRTLEYVLRDMTNPDGAFYAATDADSEGEEGLFFLWNPKQIRAVLPADDAELILKTHDITEGGNFEGHSIPVRSDSLPKLAKAHGMKLAPFLARLDRLHTLLYQTRERREHPLLDNKIVTAWNGMMITPFAQAAELLDEPRYLEAARKAAESLWKHNRPEPGRLLRSTLAGRPSQIPGGLTDYATLAEGLLHLYDASDDALWLTRAQEMADAMLIRFADPQSGGLFMNELTATAQAMARPKDGEDGATPSGNSTAVHMLAMLAARTGEDHYREQARKIAAAFGKKISTRPSAFSYMLTGVDQLLHGETTSRRYLARGKVTAKARIHHENNQHHLTVTLTTQPHWHINAHQPLQPDLIATKLSLEVKGWKLGPVHYPKAETATLGFDKEPLALYQGRVHLRATLEEIPKQQPEQALRVIPIRLKLQACSDKICLAPEDIQLWTSVDLHSL